jgi:uncharacterized repeat protein (TIGR02543 family)
MKTILGSRKHHNLKIVSIFLIVIVLIAAMVACNGDGGGAQYDLTMAVAPTGSGTATDVTDESPYAEGTDVDIEAEAAAGYGFVKWTAPAGTFADENAAETTFTMPAQDVTVTANFVLVYDLTMAVNPVGGGTATDLTNASPYPAGTVVNMNAAAAAGYTFVNWTAPAGTFADPNAPTTTFTMPSQDVTVTANFVGPLDHFKCYEVDWNTAPYVGEVVYLEDQFGAFNATVGKVMAFGNPAEKVHEGLTPISNPDHHLTFYYLDLGESGQSWQVEVNNQFGNNQTLSVYGPSLLAVPTQKEGYGKPMGLDHYLLYIVTNGPAANAAVDLHDQFHDEQGVSVTAPAFFANPVRKTHDGNVTEIENPEAHLVFYEISGGTFQTQVLVDNQFGEQTLNVDDPYLLAVPSEKIDWVQPLDHFVCYGVEGAPYVGENVTLVDQFVAINATVGEALFFANPAEKKYNDVWTLISNHDHHLTFYALDYEEEPQWWQVEFDNQFGSGWNMAVYGPVALAVPTQKLEPIYHDLPMGLDHYLVYSGVGYIPMGTYVDLGDQFNLENNVYLDDPIYFASPVQKTHGGNVTEIENSEEHLVFYELASPLPFSWDVLVSNQFDEFDEQFLDVSDAQLLAVPSEKIDWYPWSPP